MSLQTPEKIRRLQRKLYTAAKEAPERRFHQLYDKIHRRDILEHAYWLCRAKHGSPGVDGESFERIEAQGEVEWLDGLQGELRNKTYRPAAVKRVLIPKAGGGTRPLGIPTIRDRVAQTAAKLVLEPIFEADFEDGAHGYRPGRSARGAVEAVHRAMCEGYTDVVDADLSKYFDTIPHDQLMKSVARRISDRHVLKLIKSWLKVPVEERDEQGRRRMTGGKKSRQGTPQGGVISPLLANIYMNRFLKAWRQQGKAEQYQGRLVNYADDFVILTRERAGEALAWTQRVMGRIGLTLNEGKTRLLDAKREHFDFLGYTFGPERYRKDGHWYLGAKPSKKAIGRVRGSVRRILRRGNVAPWEVVVRDLNRTLDGWSNYFSYGTRLMAYRALDNYVYQRTRWFLCKRHKMQSAGTRRFADHVVFGDLGVRRLRHRHVGPPPCTVA